MKKLLLLWIAGTITLTAPILPMSMDTSDDAPSSSSAFAPGAYASAIPAPALQKARGIPAPIRKVMSEEYGMESDSVEGMAKIISAMNAQEKEELWATAYTSTSSDSDSDIDASDEELTFLADMIVADDDSIAEKGAPKKKYKPGQYHKKISAGNKILASCTECSSCIRETLVEKQPATKNQKAVRDRMEDRCRNFPDCLIFTDHALKKYTLCQEIRNKDGRKCRWLLGKKNYKGSHKQHLKVYHPEIYAALKN